MAYSLLPFEERGNFVKNWAKNTFRPFSNASSIWDEMYRGDSVLSPLAFCYLWYLLILPVVFVVMYLAWSSFREQVGQLYVMYYSVVIMFLPGNIIGFVLGPLVFMLLGGLGAHCVLWALDADARGAVKRTLRVFGYTIAWAVPFWALDFTVRTYFQMNPLRFFAKLDALNPGRGTGVIDVWFWVSLAFGFSLLIAIFCFIVWGLKSIHRVAVWKSFVASIVGFGFFYAGQMVVQAYGNSVVVSAVMNDKDEGESSPASKKVAVKEVRNAGRFHQFVKIVEDCHEEVAKEASRAAFPAPPRVVDLLTGGDWGVAIDLKQAQEGGYPPSCQVIYEQTVAALKGQIVFYASCLDEAPGGLVQGRPDPLMPPGWRASVDAVKAGLTPERRATANRIRDAYSNALLTVQSEIGPFEAKPSVQLYPPDPKPIVDRPAVDASRGPLAPEEAIAHAAFAMSQNAADPRKVNYYAIPIKKLQKIAESGDKEAMHCLGASLLLGYQRINGFSEEENKEQGLKWAIKAYDSGYRSSENCLIVAMSYRNGWGAPSDNAKFALWEKRAQALQEEEVQAMRDAEAKRRYNMR